MEDLGEGNHPEISLSGALIDPLQGVQSIGEPRLGGVHKTAQNVFKTVYLPNEVWGFEA